MLAGALGAWGGFPHLECTQAVPMPKQQRPCMAPNFRSSPSFRLWHTCTNPMRPVHARWAVQAVRAKQMCIHPPNRRPEQLEQPRGSPFQRTQEIPFHWRASALIQVVPSNIHCHDHETCRDNVVVLVTGDALTRQNPIVEPVWVFFCPSDSCPHNPGMVSPSETHSHAPPCVPNPSASDLLAYAVNICVPQCGQSRPYWGIAATASPISVTVTFLSITHYLYRQERST